MPKDESTVSVTARFGRVSPILRNCTQRIGQQYTLSCFNAMRSAGIPPTDVYIYIFHSLLTCPLAWVQLGIGGRALSNRVTTLGVKAQSIMFWKAQEAMDFRSQAVKNLI